MKRLFSLLLALILVLSMTTSLVFAELKSSTEGSEISEDEDSSIKNIDYSLYPIVTEEQAIEMIEKTFKAHKKVLRFRIEGYSDNTTNGYDYVDQLLYKAYGDIPEYYELENYVGIVLDDSALEAGCFECTFSYGYSKKQCDRFERKLKKVEKSLKLKGLSDKQKAFKIYRWITKNVKYDTKAFKVHMSGPYAIPYDGIQYAFNAYGALIKKKAVCQGIACLYYRMLKDAGVDACMISANALGSSQCHTWVLVKIGKKWYNADPTFDGTRHRNDTKYEFFLKTDKTYKKIHHFLPNKTKAFNKEHPMGKKDLKF